MTWAVEVEGLAKEYRIGAARGAPGDSPHPTLRQRLRHPGASLRAGSRGSTIWALSDVSVDVAAGEVLGVIGRNGAGKSTLLRILSRITEPTRGTATIRGRVGSLLEVGTGFHPELTGRENVYLNGAILGMRRQETARRFDAIVEFSGVEAFLDTPVKRYSSGMYTRLAFAVAAHLEPEVLLVDEVLAVGDYEFQARCLGKMRDVSAGGRTVIFVSHNMGSIANLCSRVMWLDHGRVVECGDTARIVEAYVAAARTRGAESAWPDQDADAPRAGGVRLRSVRVRDGRGRVTSDVLIGEPVAVEIEYEVTEAGGLYVWGMELKDRVGSYVFAGSNRPSANTVRDAWYGRSRPEGLYRTTCVIPANLLNDAHYSIDVRLVSQRGEPLLCVEDVVAIAAHESGAMTAEYAGHWVGAVRPRLAWTTDLVHAAVPGDGAATAATVDGSRSLEVRGG